MSNQVNFIHEQTGRRSGLSNFHISTKNVVTLSLSRKERLLQRFFHGTITLQSTLKLITEMMKLKEYAYAALLLLGLPSSCAQDVLNTRGIAYPGFRYVGFDSLDNTTQENVMTILNCMSSICIACCLICVFFNF